MKKISHWFSNWYHRLAGHVFVAVDNGRNNTVFAEWVGEFHVMTETDGSRTLIVYPLGKDAEAKHITEFTDVLIGWGWSK